MNPIMLNQITIGDIRLLVLDMAPMQGNGIEAEIGTLAVVQGEAGIYQKTGSGHTAWKLSSIDAAQLGLDLAALDARLDVLESDPVTKTYVDGEVSDLQGQITQEISDRQAAVSAEQSARESADNALDARLDIIEGPDSQSGSIAKALKDAKDYTDSEVTTLKGGVSSGYDTLKKIEDKIEFVIENTDSAALDSLKEIVDAFQSADGDINTAITNLANAASSNLQAEQEAREAEDLTFLKLDGSRPMENTLDMGENALEKVDTVYFNRTGVDSGYVGGDISGDLQVRSTSGAVSLAGTSVKLGTSGEQAAQYGQIEKTEDGWLKVSSESDMKLQSGGDIFLSSGMVKSPSIRVHDGSENPGYTASPNSTDFMAQQDSSGLAFNATKWDGTGEGIVSSADAHIMLLDADGGGLLVRSRQGANTLSVAPITLQASEIVVSSKITGLVDGVSASDAVNKGQLDAVESALDARLDALETDPVTKTYVDAQDAATLSSANSYTDSEIAGLVNSAPAVLDTLKELADALGSDPNFATTIAGQIGTLDDKIDQEIADRIADVDAEETARIAAVSAEASARAAEDLTFVKLDGSRAMSGDLDMGANDVKNVGALGLGTSSPASIFEMVDNNVKHSFRGTSTSTTGSVNAVVASLTPAADSVELVKIMVTGMDGASKDSVSYERTVRVKNIGGTVSLDTVQSDYTSEDTSMSGANCTFIVNASDVDVRVTGVNSKTITWKCLMRRMA